MSQENTVRNGDASPSEGLRPTNEPSSPPSDSELVSLQFTFGRYHGQVHPDNPLLRHGQGTLVYNSGSTYSGSWVNGAPHGVGKKQYLNGDVFAGLWENGKREGRGSYLFYQGHIFEGLYHDDQPHGYGILTTLEGDRYAGEWRAGLKHGKGVEILTSEGQLFSGFWVRGVKEGPGRLHLSGAAAPIFGMWKQDHFLRELSAHEKALFCTDFPDLDYDEAEKLNEPSEDSNVGERAPMLLPGEEKTFFDPEFEANSSDEERWQRREKSRTDVKSGESADLINSLHQARVAMPGVLPSNEADLTKNFDQVECRLDALEKALEKAFGELSEF